MTERDWTNTDQADADRLSLETCIFRLQCRVDAGRDSISISPGFAKEIISAMNRALVDPTDGREAPRRASDV